MENKKKKFIIPEAEIVTFNNDDVIATSAGMSAEPDGDWGSQDGNNW